MRRWMRRVEELRLLRTRRFPRNTLLRLYGRLRSLRRPRPYRLAMLRASYETIRVLT